MSVRKNDQRPSSFGPLDTSLKLITHTFNILSNEKVFIPRYQKFIDKIAAETAMIYHKCRVANKIDMRTNLTTIMNINAESKHPEAAHPPT